MKPFNISNYIATLHWANAADGFDSVVTLHNYYGYAFRGRPASDTDADVVVRFFKEDGSELPSHETPVPTGGSVHLAVSSVHPGFRGLVSAQMIPRGKMPRIKALPGQPQKPIATSFFMLYQRQGGFSDFSHELFPVREKPDSKPVEWATILYGRPGIRSGAVVLNNRPGQAGAEFGSDVEAQVMDLHSKPLTEPFRFHLPPGGSRMFRIEDAFPGFDFAKTPTRSAIVAVRGKNIEQPLSLHLHECGDFNIHHF